MKKNSKKIALFLACALLVSSVNPMSDASAKETTNTTVSDDVEATVEPTADVTETPSATATGGAVATTEPTADVTETPEVSKEPEVSETPDTTETPTTTTGASVTTSPAVTTSPSVTGTPDTTTGPSITVTSPAIYHVGETFTYGNYNYTVLTAPTDTSSGKVKLTSVIDTALTKTSLTVAACFKIDDYNYKVTEIGARAFKTCTKLKTINIKGGVTIIGTGAFRGIKTLKQVYLPTSLTFIKKNAFYGCTGLRQIVIPVNVNTIGVKAFYNCSSLKAIMVKGKVLKTVKKNAFGKIKSGSYMTVLSGKKTLYSSLVKNSGATKMTYYTY